MMSQVTVTPQFHAASRTRLYGRWLIIARVTWLILSIIAVSIFITDIPTRFNLILGAASNQRAVLAQLGLSENFLAVYFIAFDLVSMLVFSVTAAIIYWRRSDDWMALFISIALITYGSIATFFLYALGRISLLESVPIIFVQGLGIGSSIIFYYIFPDGRFIPHWTRVLTIVYVAWVLTWFIYPAANFITLPFLVAYLLIAFLYGIGVFAQIYRYHRFSDSIQRQQTKWVVFGAAVTSIGLAGFNAFRLFVLPHLDNVAQLQVDLVWIPFIVGCQLFVPATISIAILRHRLWEIDLVINRTLVYVPLTGILAGLFAATITLSQKLFVTVTGQQSDAATVMTTLIVVAAFTPIKDRLQALVDKRFKELPDPAKKLKAFEEQVRTRLYPIGVMQGIRRLLEEAVAAFEANGGAAYLESDGNLQLAHTAGEWKGETKLSVRLETSGTKLGLISLAARRNGAEYTAQDREALQKLASVVAQAIEQDRTR